MEQQQINQEMSMCQKCSYRSYQQPMYCPYFYEYNRCDYGRKYKPMPIKPIISSIEKNYAEFKSLEKYVDKTEINNTIAKIEQNHPDIMKKLMELGLAYEECKKIIYLILLCSEKFHLK